MYEIKLISITQIIDKGQKITKEQHEEITVNRKLMVLKPNYNMYRFLEGAGSLFILGAFNSRDLVGYSLNIISQHLQYSDLKICTNDTIFVQKKHRKGGLGNNLIKQTELEAFKKGAKLITWQTNKGTDLERLMFCKKYKPAGTVYIKEL